MQPKLFIPCIILMGVFLGTVKSEAQQVCHGAKVMLTEDGACSSGNYQLLFEDNFDGDTLDTRLWWKREAVIRDFKHVVARQWFTPANIEVSNGTLKLWCKREELKNKCFFDGQDSICEDFDFTAAQIETNIKYSFGKIEMRCKIAKGRGVASSFWTYGEEMNEIDVFEFENDRTALGKFDAERSPRVHKMNAHADYDHNERSEDCPDNYTGPDYSADFHVFSVCWTPHKLEWFVDGKRKRVNYLFYTLNGQPAECDALKQGFLYVKDLAYPRNPMNIIINNVILSNKEAPDETTAFPVFYEIDWIRYYQLQN